MYRIKKLTITTLLMVMFLITTAQIFANSGELRFLSNRFTQMEEDECELNQYNDLTIGYIKAASNDYLTLYVKPESLAIKIRNELTGYVWSSTLDEMENYRLNETWRDFVDAAITIDFVVDGGNPARESLASHTAQTTLSLVENGFQADIAFNGSGVQFQLVVTIEGADVVVSVLDETVDEPEGVQLVTMQLYPFLAAVKEDRVPGYMFIPDGAGALIRFGQQDFGMDSPFQAMIYGQDFGIDTGSVALSNPPHVVRMPVYGMVHGVEQNALLTMIESGDHYGEIIAHTAGLFTEFYWITTMFHYRQWFNQPTTRDETRGPQVQLLQEERNQFDIVMRHQILSESDANYVGMALSYQQRLVQQGILTPLTEVAPMMRLDFLGAEMQEGFLWNTVVTMTPVTTIPQHIDVLQAQGLSELMVVYTGWVHGGLSNAFPNRTRLERRVGNQQDVLQTIETLAEAHIPMYFHTDYTSVDRGANRRFGGPQLAEQINGRAIPYSLLIPRNALSQAGSDVSQFARYGIENLAISTTGSLVYSNFNDRVAASRSENIATIQALFSLLNDGGRNRIALQEPNAHFWAYTNHYLDIPMTSSGYLFATDTVPFLQIVLRGHMNYYAPVSNFSANSRLELLRMIDFGAYPSFLLTTEPTHRLAETPSRNIFTSEFDVWSETVVADYHLISKALGSVRGEPIVWREVLTPGVVRVTYANGVSIMINYTQNDFYSDGVRVEAENFLVIDGG